MNVGTASHSSSCFTILGVNFMVGYKLQCWFEPQCCWFMAKGFPVSPVYSSLTVVCSTWTSLKLLVLCFPILSFLFLEPPSPFPMTYFCTWGSFLECSPSSSGSSHSSELKCHFLRNRFLKPQSNIISPQLLSFSLLCLLHSQHSSQSVNSLICLLVREVV